MFRKAIVACVAAVVLAPAVGAQGRVVPPPKLGDGMGPMSEFDLYGHMNAPVGPLALQDCTAWPCQFDSSSSRIFAQNIRFTGTPNYCRQNINSNWLTVFSQTFQPNSNEEYVGITFGAQAAISNVVATTNPHGLSLRCTVTQGTSSVPCPGTMFLPFLTRQGVVTGSTTLRVGGLNYVAYHGMIRLADDITPVTVTIEVRSSDTTDTILGNLCVPYVEIEFYRPGSMT